MSVDTELTEQQSDFVNLCRQFVADTLKPWMAANRALEWDAPPEDRLPTELMKAADKIGLRTLGLPVEHGGVELDCMTQSLMVEQLAIGEPGFTTTIVQNWKVAAEFGRHASPDLAERTFAQFSEDASYLWANCLTEPRGASDRVLPYDSPDSSMQTTAVAKDGGWVLNGVKHFVSNGGTARGFIVYANTNPSKGIRDGVSSFFVERGTPGFSVARINEKVGHRLTVNAELLFDDCWVPAENLLVRDKALRRAGKYLLIGRILNAARALGVMQAAVDATSRYVQEHFQGGKIIIKHQAVASHLANMLTSMEVSRSMVYRASRAIDTDAANAPGLALMAKLHCADAVFDITRMAMELHGGSGVMREMGIEKMLRDATVFSHTEGTADMQRFKIIKALFPDTAGVYAGPDPS